MGRSPRAKRSRSFCQAFFAQKAPGGQGDPKNPKRPRSETLHARSPRQKNESRKGKRRARSGPKPAQNSRTHAKPVGQPVARRHAVRRQLRAMRICVSSAASRVRRVWRCHGDCCWAGRACGAVFCSFVRSTMGFVVRMYWRLFLNASNSARVVPFNRKERMLRSPNILSRSRSSLKWWKVFLSINLLHGIPPSTIRCVLHGLAAISRSVRRNRAHYCKPSPSSARQFLCPPVQIIA